MYAPMFLFWSALTVVMIALYPVQFGLLLGGWVVIRLWRSIGMN
jgi:hypothetical protein